MADRGRSVSVVRVLLWAGLLGLLLGLALTSHSVRADPVVLYVMPGVSGDCFSWDTACTLQDALAVATSGDEIWVAAGVYTPGTLQTDTFLLADGVALYGGFAGTEANREDRDWQTHLSILTGDIGGDDITDPNGVVTTTTHIVGVNAFHVVNSSLKEAVVDGFIITAGQAGGYGSRLDSGGGLINVDGIGKGYDLTLANLVFSGNYARVDGGAFFNYGTPVSLTNILFSGNRADSAGGGMAVTYHSLPMLTDVTFSGNAAKSGGAMYSSNSSATLTRVTFMGNSGYQGGAIHNTDLSSPRLVDVVFSRNEASDSGGAMFNVSQSSPTLTNVTFSGNSAPLGGAIRNHWICVPKLVNVTFQGNVATNGGAIYNSYRSVPVLANAILWGNTPNEIGNEDDSCAATVTYSDVQGGWPGTGNIDTDPLFVDATNADFRLDFASPSIDAGDNSEVPAGITTDLDGGPRYADIPMVPDTGSGTPPLIDMGAYEARMPATVSKSADDLTPTVGQVLTVTVSVTNTGPGLDGGLLSDTLPAGLHFVGPVTLEPPGAGVAGSDPATLAHSLTLATHGQITVTFPVSVTGAVGTQITNTAVFSAPVLPGEVRGSVMVTIANSSPLFESTPVVTATEGVLYTYLTAASDPDVAHGDALTITASALPAWLSLTDYGDGTATLAGTPGKVDVGEHAVVLGVVDAYGATDTQAFTLTVFAEPRYYVFLPLTVKGSP